MGRQIEDRSYRLGRLVDLIYSTLDDPARWRQVMEAVCQYFEATGAALVKRDFTSGQSELVAASPHFPPPNPESGTYDWSPQNPWCRSDAPYQTGAVLLGTDLLKDRDLVRQEIYRNCLGPLGVRHRLCGVIDRHGMKMDAVVMVRPPGQPRFRDSVRPDLEALVAHIHRVFDLALKIESDRLKCDALDRIPVACLLVNRSSDVRYCNAAAGALLASGAGLRLVAGRLCGHTRDQSSSLWKSVSELAAQPAAREARQPAHLTLAGGGTPRPTFIRMFAIGQQSALFPNRTDAAVAILAKSCDDGGIETIENFAAAYALTPAETRLVSRIAHGRGLFEAARDLGISRNTARTHNRHIHEKLHVHSQANLVRLLGQAGVI